MNWRVLLLISVFVILFIVTKWSVANTDDFRISNVQYEVPYHPEWEVESLAPVQKHLLNHILHQHFTYLGKGDQCYAFLSEDGKWVLKMFIVKHLKPSPLFTLIPSVGKLQEYKQSIELEKRQQLEGLLNSYKLAYDVYRPESGCLYMHFNNSQRLNRAVSVTDKLGREWTVDLDPLAFVIQQRAVPLRDEMDQLLSRDNVRRAKKRIRQTIALYLRQYALGIHDWEKDVMNNNGFVGEKPVHFGVEDLIVDESVQSKEAQIEHLVRVCQSMEQWVSSHFPEYRQELIDEMELGLGHVFGQKIHFTYKRVSVQ